MHVHYLIKLALDLLTMKKTKSPGIWPHGVGLQYFKYFKKATEKDVNDRINSGDRIDGVNIGGSNNLGYYKNQVRFDDRDRWYRYLNNYV